MKKESDKFNIAPLIIGCLIFLAVDYYALWYLYIRVTPSFTEKTVELGTAEVSLNADDYLTGMHIFHSDAWVDTSKLNAYVEGSYPVVVYLSDKEYEYTIVVEDTTPPDIDEKLITEDDYIELGADYSAAVEELFNSIHDESGIFGITLYVDDEEVGTAGITNKGYFTGEDANAQFERLKESFDRTGNGFFDERKTYDIKLVAVDDAGNTDSRSFSVEVKDTLPPEIVTYDEDEQPYYATGRKYEPEDFVKEVTDASDFFSMAFIVDEEPLAYIEYDDMGDHEVIVYAVDESGNEIRVPVIAPFDEPPMFIAVRNKDVKLGEDYDLLYHIIAVDNTDGDVSASVTVDDGGFDKDVEGTYNVKYTATDSHGLTTEIVSELTVGDEKAGAFFLTDEEMDLLCEYDFFEYDILPEEDYTAVLDLIEPAQVNMMYSYSNAYSWGYSAGSGFIYRIEEDYTYIVSCTHVYKEFEGDVEIMFCDEKGTSIDVEKPFYMQMSDENEVAMIRIPTSEIPADVLVEIKAIYCDENVYDDLKKGQNVVAYSGHFLNGKPKIGKMAIQSLDEYFMSDARNCVKTTHDIARGMSGGSVCDLYGRLIGVVEGYMSLWNFDKGDYDNSDFLLRIEGLEDLYERLKQ